MRAEITLTPAMTGQQGTKYAAPGAENGRGGITLRFGKIVGKRPVYYSVELAPAAGTGTWRTADEDGTIEHVVQMKGPDGATLVKGMWAEAGQIHEMFVTLRD